MRRILTATFVVLLGGMAAWADAVSELRPAIQDAARQNGVDPVLMEAIIRHESANATSRAARTKNNLAGIMGRRGQRVYASKEECVRHLGSILARYKARGRVTVAQIGRIYCQTRSPWAANVRLFMQRIRAGRWGDVSIYNLPAEATKKQQAS